MIHRGRTGWARDAAKQLGLKPSELLVLISLIEIADWDTGVGLWARGAKALAEDCMVSRRSLFRHLDKLCRLGLIRRARLLGRDGVCRKLAFWVKPDTRNGDWPISDLCDGFEIDESPMSESDPDGDAKGPSAKLAPGGRVPPVTPPECHPWHPPSASSGTRKDSKVRPVDSSLRSESTNCSFSEKKPDEWEQARDRIWSQCPSRDEVQGRNVRTPSKAKVLQLLKAACRRLDQPPEAVADAHQRYIAGLRQHGKIHFCQMLSTWLGPTKGVSEADFEDGSPDRPTTPEEQRRARIRAAVSYAAENGRWLWLDKWGPAPRAEEFKRAGVEPPHEWRLAG